MNMNSSLRKLDLGRKEQQKKRKSEENKIKDGFVQSDFNLFLR